MKNKSSSQGSHSLIKANKSIFLIGMSFAVANALFLLFLTTKANDTILPANPVKSSSQGSHRLNKPMQRKYYRQFGIKYYPLAKVEPGYKEIGIASWYGHDYDGRRMSSGRRFDANKIHIAHKTLPLGTKVAIKNLKNGKVLIGKIEDRGPYKSKRIIDLSLAAARQLGYEKQGLTTVEVKVIKR